MSTILGSLVFLGMSLVISNEEIVMNLPPGTPAAVVESYFDEIDTKWLYVDRKNPPLLTPEYPWLQSDVGYYVAHISKVSSHWWLPSFGKNLLVYAGISAQGQVTQVVTFSGRTGVP